MSNEAFDLVIGLGITGKACVRYLAAQGMAVRVLDTRAQPPGLDAWRAEFPDLPLHTGGWREDWMGAARRLIVSPGIAISTPEIARLIADGKEVVGDIELFARAASVPVAAITGSNAKSTVTMLLGDMAHAASRQALVGGNLGTPALELLETDTHLYVLELSSFQLETTYSLGAQAAVILNVSEDHMDRYHSLSDYIAAKQRIYDGCEVAVWNRDDEATRPQGPVPREITFGSDAQSDYRLDAARQMLMCRGVDLLPASALAMRGNHNALNVLAALAMAEALDIPREPALAAAARFAGLPHRCQLVAEQGGVQWFNDSKGTNVGATLAALAGIGPAIEGQVILVAGGQGKGQDFTPLAAPAATHVRAALLLGEDADKLALALDGVPCEQVADMTAAVARAAALAMPGDAVLLSPACASFDMYSGYVARGEDFIRQVREVTRER
ncbi:MAG: UDP-N-acetylmuramoyl-L-alanine--D-glutamate ligase [Alcanivorax sp.]|nr:UDP-N-acetylmuramoyl-L-alanine--D-glutamate ligase [Alcanivorax sp.]